MELTSELVRVGTRLIKYLSADEQGLALRLGDRPTRVIYLGGFYSASKLGIGVYECVEREASVQVARVWENPGRGAGEPRPL
jgi:hypothetical protein